MMSTSQHTQGELPLARIGRTAKEMHAILLNGKKESTGLQVRITDNRSTMISVRRPASGGIRVGMHREFLSAPPEILESIRRFIWKGDRESWRRVGVFARGISVRSPSTPQNGKRSEKGRVYDLGEILDDVNRVQFQGRLSCRVGWGRRTRRRRRGAARYMRFGSWDSARRLITVNPLLDDRSVPREFVRYILFHEMLHAQVPNRVLGSRRYCHTPEFRRLEKAFPRLREMKGMAQAVMRRVTT